MLYPKPCYNESCYKEVRVDFLTNSADPLCFWRSSLIRVYTAFAILPASFEHIALWGSNHVQILGRLQKIFSVSNFFCIFKVNQTYPITQDIHIKDLKKQNYWIIHWSCPTSVYNTHSHPCELIILFLSLLVLWNWNFASCFCCSYV